MGQLKPGATYIYEKHESVTYAREFGSAPATRVPIGWEYNAFESRRSKMQEDKMWGEIRRMAETHPALQKALENVILIYKLAKESE